MKSSGVQELGRLRDGAIWGGFTQVVEEKVTVSQSFFDDLRRRVPSISSKQSFSSMLL